MPDFSGGFRWLLFSAVCAGAIAGLAMGGLHLLVHVSLIEQAEVYEAAAATAAAPAVIPTGMAPVHVHAPETRMRAMLTLIADMLAGIGFALLLCAGLALRGGMPTAGRGLGWGLGGFCAFAVAPALGLPPELPGAGAADLIERQVWWLATVGATAGGLALVVFGHGLYRAVAGVVLIAAPHLFGAPRPPPHVSLVPDSLTRSFVAASLGTNLLFWALLGVACAFAMRHLAPNMRGTDR